LIGPRRFFRIWKGQMAQRRSPQNGKDRKEQAPK